MQTPKVRTGKQSLKRCSEFVPKLIHSAHLARAKWMTTSGYGELLGLRLH
jgi:hypothetical protein